MIRNTRGNAMLETVLFMPLALFFLFIVIDTGLSLLQRASLEDDFRSAIHSTAAYAKTISPLSVQEFDEENIRDLVNSVSEELFSNVSSSFGVLPDASDSLFAVSVVAFELSITAEGQTGSIEQLSRTEIPVQGLSAVASKVPSTQFLSMQEFINLELDQDTQSTVSKYAHPVGFMHTAEGGSNDNYKNRSILIYVELRAIPKGLNLAFVGQTFGQFFSIQKQSLRAIRLQ